MTTRIACAGISGRILQGRVSADRLSFTGQTKDVTSDVLAAVIDKLKHHGGSFTINCDGKPIATLTLSAPTEQQQGGEAVEVVASIAVDAEGVVRDFTLEPGLDRHPGGYTVTPLMTVAQHQRILAAATHPADQVADDLTMVKVSRELLEQIAVELEHDNDRYFLGRELRALLNGGQE